MSFFLPIFLRFLVRSISKDDRITNIGNILGIGNTEATLVDDLCDFCSIIGIKIRYLVSVSVLHYLRKM